MQYYDLKYHKALNRSHILPNILNGAKSGIYSQFIADIVVSVLLYQNQIIEKDIIVSEISSYYAAVASGMLSGFLIIYMDPFATAIFSSIAYTFVFEIVEYQTINDPIELDAEEIISDAVFAVILLYLFDPVAHNQYLRYQQKRHLIEPTYKRMDRTNAQNIFFIVLVNTFSIFSIDDNKLKNLT